MSRIVARVRCAVGEFGLVAALLVVALTVALTSGRFPPKAQAAYPDWDGKGEVPFSGSLQTTGTALIASAVTTPVANRLAVKGVTLTGATAGIYVFFSGSTPSGAHQIGAYYLVANTPLKLTSDDLRAVGLRSASGEGIYCVGPGILTWSGTLWYDPSS